MLLDRSPRKRGGLYFLREPKYEQNQTNRHQHSRGKALVFLFRSENAVACVAEAWANVGSLVQAAVQMPDINLDIGMSLV